MTSFKQLDKDLQQLSINDLLVLNQIGEKNQLEKDTKSTIFRVIAIYGFIMCLLTALTFTNILIDYVLLGLTLSTISIGAWAFKRGEKYAMLGLAGITGLWSIHYLLIGNIINSEINGTNIIIGAILLMITLSHIKTVNQYTELDQKTLESSHNDLYTELYQLLDSSVPNASNTLIELKAINEKINVWLRPSGIVILSKSKKRLYFDVNQSFKITIRGKDTGGDTIRVNASLIDRLRPCWISRHGWLRYTQFKR